MLAAQTLPIADITALTTIDWPQRLAAVIYTRGCPWRCPYCHNTELQNIVGDTYDWDRILALVNTRRGLLDGVVFTGGEPCMHEALLHAMEEIKSLGFGVALHTGGAFPERLSQALSSGLVDWVGFDMKAPWELYEKVTKKPGSGKRAKRSLYSLVESGVDYEIRTTVWPNLLQQAHLEIMAHQLKEANATSWMLQPCRDCPGKRDPEPQDISLPRMASHLGFVLPGQVFART